MQGNKCIGRIVGKNRSEDHKMRINLSENIDFLHLLKYLLSMSHRCEKKTLAGFLESQYMVLRLGRKTGV
jgi:hypothetical protein